MGLTTFEFAAFVRSLAAGQPAGSVARDGDLGLAALADVLPLETNVVDNLHQFRQVGSPVLTSDLTVEATQGLAFSYTITATNSPTSFSASPLPSWASFNSATGVISGTPDNDGLVEITVAANNAAGSSSATLTITVEQGGISQVNLKLHVAADEITTPLGVGNTITQWDDISEDAFDLTLNNSAGASVRGTYMTGGQNGKPFVRFDGADDRLSRSSGVSQLGDSATTVFMVAKLLKPSPSQFIMDSPPDSSPARRYLLVGTTGLTLGQDGGGGSIVSNSYTAGNVCLITAVIAGAASKLRINGGSEVTGSLYALGVAWQEFVIGSRFDGSTYTSVDYYEIAVYDAIISGATLTETENFLKTKYGIA